jgi:hypothetical protein
MTKENAKIAPLLFYPVCLGAICALMATVAGAQATIATKSAYFQYFIYGLGGSFVYGLVRLWAPWKVIPMAIVIAWAIAAAAGDLWMPLTVLGAAFLSLLTLFFEVVWRRMGANIYLKIVFLAACFVLFEVLKILILPHLPSSWEALHLIFIYRVVKNQFIQAVFTGIGLGVGLVLGEEILEKFPEIREAGRWKTRQN